MDEKPYHQWEVLTVGEMIAVSLPLIDLVPVQERLARERNMVFKLETIPVNDGPLKTRVTRVL